MPRPALKPGEWGNLHFTKLEDGRVRVHARCRAQDGGLRRLRVVARNERECIGRLEEASGLRVPRGALVPADRPDLLTRSSTLLELARCWLALERDSGRMNEATHSSLAGHIANHLSGSLGARRLDGLSAYMIDRDLLLARRRQTPAVVRRTRSIVMRALELATVYGLVAENFALYTRPVRLPSRAPVALALEDVALLRARMGEWASAAPITGKREREQLRLMFEVALGTGLRLGELLAIRVTALDRKFERLTVSATVTWSPTDGAHVADSLKRNRQRRVLPLPAFASDALMSALSLRPRSSEFVFADDRGEVMSPNRVRALLREFLRHGHLDDELQSIRVDDLTFKVLRATVATHLATSAELANVRDQLGHAFVSTTERSYVAPRLEVVQQNRDVLERLFAPGAA